MDIERLKKLIGDSFLSDEAKRELRTYLELKGADLRFFSIFNDRLVEATKERGEKYQKLMKKFDGMVADLDGSITADKKRVDDNIENELSAISATDTRTKARLWDEYYVAMNELENKYSKGVKELASKIMAEAKG